MLLPDPHQMKEQPFIRRESIDRSGNETRFPQTSTSSNDACAIELFQLMPKVETGKIKNFIQLNYYFKTVQVSMLQSCENNNALSQPQFDMESMCCKCIDIALYNTDSKLHIQVNIH